MSSGPARQKDPLIGTLIDRRYRVIKRLGDGGMGIVYQVEHTYLNKLFALKVMRPTKDEVDRKRFEQEARIASSIHHPNVVEISDFGVLPTDQPYFVMEFLRGHTLGNAIAEDLLDPLLSCLIGVQIASGLQSVHKQSVVHRDLKPDNIFLVDPDESDDGPAGSSEPSRGTGSSNTSDGGGDVSFVKIMDFGIAKATDHKLTGTGMTVGTPEYMSPEQATGDKVDWRTDQYSLGCILYEMLTGALPFEGRHAFEIMNKHLSEPPMPIRQRRPDRAAQISVELEQVVLQMMAKQRTARFGSMRAIEQALREQAQRLTRSRLQAQKTVISLPPLAPPSDVPPPSVPRSDVPPPSASPAVVRDTSKTIPFMPVFSQPPPLSNPEGDDERSTIPTLPSISMPPEGGTAAVPEDGSAGASVASSSVTPSTPAESSGYAAVHPEQTRLLPALSLQELIPKIGNKVRSRSSLAEVPSWQRLVPVRWLLRLWYRARAALESLLQHLRTRLHR